jgi:hypothetical protein
VRTLFTTMVLCAAFSVLIAPTVRGAESSPEIPNLVGSWVGEYKVYLHTGQKMASAELRITEQDGPHFRGVNAWKDAAGGKPMTTKKGKLITQDSEPFVGIIGFDGKSITIVEQDDMGTLHGELEGKDTMRLIYGEPGSNAMVFRMVLKRKQ